MIYNRDNQLKEVVYTPESKLRRPLELLRSMRLDLLSSKELAWRLLVRNLRGQYRQSFLGIFWAFIPAITTAAAFTFASGSDVIKIEQTDIPYPAYVMFSVTIWQTFTEAIYGPIRAIASARSMLTKINFPREAIIVAKLGEILFNFAIKMLLIIILFLCFRVPVNWTVVLAPIALLNLLILGTALGLVLAPFNVLYQDVANSLPIVMGAWVFFTPVVYPVPSSGLFALIVQINPVTPLLLTIKELTTTGIVSSPVEFWVVSSLSLVGFLLAWTLYRLTMPIVIERLGS